ncbi:MAG: NUDIX domain-containing protein [Pseudomonadota bacterium]
MAAELSLAVAVIRNLEGHMLVVRKAGTTTFMQPGGKIDDGETPEVALCRELYEELELHVTPGQLRHVAHATAPAANERETLVSAEIFELEGRDWPEFRPNSELEELRWIDRTTTLPLAALTSQQIMPRVWSDGVA